MMFNGIFFTNFWLQQALIVCRYETERDNPIRRTLHVAMNQTLIRDQLVDTINDSRNTATDGEDREQRFVTTHCSDTNILVECSVLSKEH